MQRGFAMLALLGKSALVLSLGAVSSCVGMAEEDPGEMGKRVEQVAGFERLLVGGAYDVEVTTGSAPSLSMEGPGKMLDAVVIEQKGDLLKIAQKKGKWNWGGDDDVTIRITVPMLKEIGASGASEIRVDRIEADAFTAKLSGAGEIDLDDVVTDQLVMALSGAGELTASGRTRLLKVGLSGAGEFDGADLQAEIADLRASGAGSIRAHVTGKATGGVSGAGEVTVTGGADCDIRTSGAADVNCS